VVHTFRGRVAAWWQQLKQSKVQQGKLKINSWEKLLKKLQVTFLPHKYTMERQLQNWRQWSTIVTKKIEKSYKKEVFRETWIEAAIPQQTFIHQPQLHLPNLNVEREDELVDEEFQKFKILNEKFEHEGVEDEDPSQGFIDWDS
jgi:hypothetical protein